MFERYLEMLVDMGKPGNNPVCLAKLRKKIFKECG
jgi:hypothetical protein